MTLSENESLMDVVQTKCEEILICIQSWRESDDHSCHIMALAAVGSSLGMLIGEFTSGRENTLALLKGAVEALTAQVKENLDEEDVG